MVQLQNHDLIKQKNYRNKEDRNSQNHFTSSNNTLYYLKSYETSDQWKIMLFQFFIQSIHTS